MPKSDWEEDIALLKLKWSSESRHYCHDFFTFRLFVDIAFDDVAESSLTGFKMETKFDCTNKKLKLKQDFVWKKSSPAVMI